MADGAEPIDFWDVLDEAELTVELWPAWQQRYDVDLFYDGVGDVAPEPVPTTPPPAQRVYRAVMQ